MPLYNFKDVVSVGFKDKEIECDEKYDDAMLTKEKNGHVPTSRQKISIMESLEKSKRKI